MSKEFLAKLLSGRFSKDDMVDKINSGFYDFKNLIEFSFSDKKKVAWRSIWLIGQCINYNDNRIKPYINDYLKYLKDKDDGHQREILKILEKIAIPDDLQGILYDECIFIWKDVNRSSSVRITAFRILADIATKYPDLINEIELLIGKEYYETLSDGIKYSFDRIKKELMGIKYK